MRQRQILEAEPGAGELAVIGDRVTRRAFVIDARADFIARGFLGATEPVISARDGYGMRRDFRDLREKLFRGS